MLYENIRKSHGNEVWKGLFKYKIRHIYICHIVRINRNGMETSPLNLNFTVILWYMNYFT